MHRVWRFFVFVLLLAAAVCLVAMAFLFVPLQPFAGWVQWCVQAYSWLPYVFAALLVCAAVGALVLLVCVCVLPRNANYFKIKRELGVVQLSRGSIEAVAGLALRQFPAVRRSLVRVRRWPRSQKLKITLRAEIDAVDNLAALSDAMQQQVALGMQAALGIAPEKVRIKLVAYKPTEAVEPEERGGPRVV